MPGFRREGRAPTRIFFAADLHGSQTAYRKFLNAASFYRVDALVFGGDLMGKLFVPIVRDDGDGVLRARFGGEGHAFDRDGPSRVTAAIERGYRRLERTEGGKGPCLSGLGFGPPLPAEGHADRPVPEAGARRRPGTRRAAAARPFGGSVPLHRRWQPRGPRRDPALPARR